MLVQGTGSSIRKDTREVQVSRKVSAVSVAFDEDNLLVDAGLVPVMALAEQAGLGDLVDEQIEILGAKNAAGANAGAKVTSIVAGMVAGADRFDDMNRLQVGAAGQAVTGLRAPSTRGTFARAFTHGHNQQLEHAFRKTTANLIDLAGMLPEQTRSLPLTLNRSTWEGTDTPSWVPSTGA